MNDKIDYMVYGVVFTLLLLGSIAFISGTSYDYGYDQGLHDQSKDEHMRRLLSGRTETYMIYVNGTGYQLLNENKSLILQSIEFEKLEHGEVNPTVYREVLRK